MLKPFILMVILSTLLLTSCKKYDDGPRISLRSKKERVINCWRVESLYKNGVQETLTGFEMEARTIFEKGGLVTVTNTQVPTKSQGTWVFADNKNTLQVTIYYEVVSTSGNSVSTINYTILKLKEKELWLKETDSKGDVYEYHYVSVL